MNQTNEGTATTLLRAARQVFAQRGYDGASIRAITRRAGVNLGAVTYHYGSKKALYSAVLESVLGPLEKRIVEATQRDAPALERIEAAVRAFFAHLAENPDQPRLLLQEVTAGKSPPPAVKRIMRKVLGSVIGIVEEGQAAGSIREGDPILLAAGIISQPVYMTLVQNVARELVGLDLTEPDTRARVVDHAVRFVRQGLAPRETAT